MGAFLFFDTETTGLIDWPSPSDAEHQPHLVELFAMLVDEDTHEVIDSLHSLVRPDGWEVSEEVSAIHGITHARALAEGRPEVDVVTDFLALHARASLRIAHNQTFDARIIRCAIKRYLGIEHADAFREAPAFCTMKTSTPIVKLPRNKWPKLAEAYKFFFGEEMVGAHSAKADTENCAKVFFAIREWLRQEAAEAAQVGVL